MKTKKRIKQTRKNLAEKAKDFLLCGINAARQIMPYVDAVEAEIKGGENDEAE